MPPSSPGAPRTAGLSITTRVAADAADQAAYISDWQQEYAQISTGNFHGRIDELRSGTFQVFREYSHQETYQTCQPWQHSVWFGIPAPGSGERLRFNGCAVEQASILVSPGNTDFTLRTPLGFCIYGVVLNVDDLAARCDGLLNTPLPTRWLQADAITLDAGSHQRICHAIEQLLAFTRQHPDTRCHRQHLEALADALLLGLYQGQTREAAAWPTRHIQQIEQIRQWAQTPGDNELDVESLCQALHVTRRTLQNHFQTITGMSPANFVRVLRLNAVRQALRDEQRLQQTIQQLAAEWGFFNLSHFCYDYKRLFGETPSQTRHLDLPTHPARRA